MYVDFAAEKKTISIAKFVTNHALPLREDWRETDGAGFDAWTDASVFRGTCEKKVVTPLGRLRTYNVYWKSTALLGGANTSVRSVDAAGPSLVRSKSPNDEECVIFNAATDTVIWRNTHLFQMTQHTLILTQKKMCCPEDTSRADENDTF